MILASSIVFLGILPLSQRLEICASLAMVLDSTEMANSEFWVEGNIEDLIKFYKRMLKCLGLPKMNPLLD